MGHSAFDFGRWARLLGAGTFTSDDVPAFAGISGGGTSGMMAALLDPKVVLTFQNTGREHKGTYEFLEALDEALGLRIVWLEFRKPRVKGARPRDFEFAIVNARTADKSGAPFLEFLEAIAEYRATKGEPPLAPWARQRICTAYMKQKVCDAYVRSLGITDCDRYVGLRYDEPDRVMGLKEYDTRKQTFRCPLFDAKIVKPDVLEFWAQQAFRLGIKEPEGNCTACFAGETEVVTADGIFPIRDLAGGSHDLLVPKVSDGILSEVGHFVTAPVRSFGTQRLWRVELAGHGRATKVVHATEDHRWFLTRPRAGARVPTEPVVTRDLRPGMRMRNLFRCPIGEERGGMSEIAALRGFILGDGSAGQGDRPATITVYSPEKMEAFGDALRTLCGEPKDATGEGRGLAGKHFYGLPNYWKNDFPSLRESRHYLLGYLSGWFGADGCVSEDGNATLHSATRSHLQFARSICATLGVQCSGIVEYSRLVEPPGGGPREHTMYKVSFNRHHLPLDFFRLRHHRARAESNGDKDIRRYGWTVRSVEPTDRFEEVFCATVDGVGAFALADGLMTGNCFLKDQGDLARLLMDEETDPAWWIALERTYPNFGGKNFPGYEQLAMEGPPRLRIEAALREGREPEPEPNLNPRRFRLVVKQEERRLRGEVPTFNCACEQSYAIADADG